MTPREKKIAMVVLGLAGVYGGYRLIDGAIVKPRGELVAEIGREEARAEELSGILAMQNDFRARWQAQTARTLPGSPSDVQGELRRRVGELMDKHKLSTGRQITPMAVRTVQKPPGKDFVEISMRVQAEAPLKDISGFLKDVHELPFFVRVDKLTLHPQQADTAAARKAGGDKKGAKPSNLPDGPRIQTTVELTTLTLPSLKGEPHPSFNPEKPVELPPRLDADPAAYAAMVAKNPFKVYEPLAVVKAHDTPKTEPTKIEPKPPPPNPRPDADKLTLVAVESLHGKPIAYVKHDTKLEPPKEYRLNEAIDDGGDGKLVLVDPRGIVVRVRSAKAPADPAKFFFYPLGGKFSERQELSATDHAEIYKLLSSVVELAKT